MKTLTLPSATASSTRRALASYVSVPVTFGAVATWCTTDGNAIRPAMAHKAHGTRRLGEAPT